VLRRFRLRGTWSVLLGYCVVSFLAFGLRLLIEPGHVYEGVYDDPQIPIWSFAWWPHAILHGQNPFVTHAIWAPSGVDLAWANTLPPLALLLAPLTWLAGPFVSYDLAVVLLPALSAWTAFLLCRHLTGKLWPSLAGGYLFGFSSYVLGHLAGQPQLTAVFLLPLAALLALRFVEGELGGRRFALLYGLLLGVQLYLALEIAFSLTLALGAALVLAYLFLPERRTRLRASLRPLAGAYCLAGLVAAPMLYFALSNPRESGFTPPGAWLADIANLVIPTHVEALGAGWSESVSAHFPGNSTEQGVYLGLPILIILVLFAWERRRSPGGRFLVAFIAVAAYASLGPELTVYGHRLIPLPTPFGHDTVPGLGKHPFPIFDNTLAVRLTLYTSLAVAVAVALWAAAPRPGERLRALALGLGILFLLPNPGVWTTRYSIPPFFTDARYRPCLPPNANVLPEPIGSGGQAMLWQVADGFRFRMAGGRIQTSPPSGFLHPDSLAQISVGYPPVGNQAALLSSYISHFGVTDAIVDKRDARVWAPALDQIATPHDLGGVLLYPIGGSLPPGCPAS